MVALTSKSKIIITDDTRMHQVIFSKLFDPETFEVHLASDGYETLMLMQQIEPDVILIDLMMPGMDGFTLLSEIRNQYNTVEMPVIVVSASKDINDIAQALKLGANDYITKPFDIDDYLKRVNRQIEAKQYLSINAPASVVITKYIQAPTTLVFYIFLTQQTIIVDVEPDKMVVMGRSDVDSERPIDVDFLPFHGSQSGISREHAYLEFDTYGLTIVDNDSTNGTYINEKRIPAHVPHPLRDRDHITLGFLIFKVMDVNA